MFSLAAVALLFGLSYCSDKIIGSNVNYPDQPPYVNYGRKIVYASNASGDFNIYMMYEDGTEIEQITDGPGNEYHPAVSADGNKIAYTDGQDIFVIDLASGDKTRITHDSRSYESPALSNDGTKLVYDSRKAGVDSIFVYDLLTETVTSFRHTFGFIHRFDWSPDGNEILVSCHGTEANLFLLDLNTAESTRILDNAAYGCWSDQGNSIIYAEFSTADIKRYNRSTGETSLILTDSYVTSLSVSQDGDVLLFSNIYGSHGAAHARNEIFEYYIEDSMVVKITSNRYEDQNPVWLKLLQDQ